MNKNSTTRKNKYVSITLFPKNEAVNTDCSDYKP